MVRRSHRLGCCGGIPAGDADQRLVGSSHRAGALTLYASWNGATRVASWRVLGGSTANSLARLARAPWSGFETTIELHSSPRYFAVQAVDSNGHLLGTSAVHSR